MASFAGAFSLTAVSLLPEGVSLMGQGGAGVHWGSPAALWLIVILLLAGMFLARYNPLKLLAWPLRQLSRLISRLRGASRSAQSAATGTAASASGTSLFGPLARAFSSQTLTDTVLDGLEKRRSEIFDTHGGLLFKWLHPKSNAVPNDTKSSLQISGDEDAEDEEARSHALFHFDLPMSEMLEGNTHEYFYEDVDSQFIVRLFRGADRANPDGLEDPEDPSSRKLIGPDDIVYYISSIMRKVINGNVRRLATWQTLILTVVFLSNVFFSYIYDAYFSVFGQPLLKGADFGFVKLGPGDVFTILAFVSAFALILFLNFIYNVSQRNNARELDTYIRSYLAYLNARFRAADATCTRAIGSSGAAEGQHDDVRSGIITLHWLAWRTFFIEKFLRGIFYQIKRNTFNYMLFIPVAFIIATGFAYNGLQSSNEAATFREAWLSYQKCMSDDTSDPAQCAAELSRARTKGIYEYLGTFSNCTQRGADGQCVEGASLDDKVAEGILSPPPGADDIADLDPAQEDDGKARRALTNLTTHICQEAGINSQPWLFFVLFGIQILWYIYNLTRAPRTVRESFDENTWIEFHKMRLEETTQNIMDRFIQEISNWRDRFNRGGGPG